MKETDAALIAGELKATLASLHKLEQLFLHYEPEIMNRENRTIRDAIFVSDLLCRIYTCVETVFLRISRAFENHLADDAWHKELLHKMRLEIPGVRPAVISEATFRWLDEMRRFRHFQRYYYDVELDWVCLERLVSIYKNSLPQLKSELEAYAAFCVAIAGGDEEGV